MEALKTAWDFFQNEVLGMSWLYRLKRLRFRYHRQNWRKHPVFHL